MRLFSIRFAFAPSVVSDFFIGLPKPFDLFVVELFEINQQVAGALGNANQFIQLEVKRLSVFVLGVLDEEDHEKGHDCGAGIDYQLPRIAIAK